MAFGLKHAAATILTALAALAYVATKKDWGVPLIGHSNRWAAGAILLLGIMACTLGQTSDPKRWGAGTILLAAFGAAALVIALVTLVTGSETTLLLLIADFIGLWAVSTLRRLLVGRPSLPKRRR
jgi:hypothetical protein